MLTKHTYTKMNQDLAKNKIPNDIYWEGRNIRLITNDEFGAVTNEKGNELVVTIPLLESNPTTKQHLDLIPYPVTNVTVKGHTTINETLILLCSSEDKFLVYTVDKDFTVSLIFFDLLDISYPIDVKGFYENENNQKIYFADGTNELRFMNISDPDLINLDVNFISSVPNVNLSNPNIIRFETGGIHTSGVIQYAYNLYNLNGAQTKISPLSELVPLNNNNKGDDIDTSVNKSPVVRIENVDTDYEFLRLYSIKYSSLGATPQIQIVTDTPITNDIVEIVDDNNSVISEITFSEFTFLGGDIYIPQHLNTKDNHLFLANYKTIPFDIEFDTRAYSFDTNGDGKVLDKDGNETLFTDATIPSLATTHDAINPTIKAITGDADYNKYIYDSFGNLGGTGLNVKYNIKYRTVNTNIGTATMDSSISVATSENPNKLTGLKRGEVYRIGIEFQNTKGQYTFAKWIADVKIPEIDIVNKPVDGNGVVKYPYIEVELLNQPSETNITGWRILIVERTQADKTVLTQGFFNPTIKDNKSPGYTIYPSYFTRTFRQDNKIPDYLNPVNEAVNPSQDVREYIFPMRYNTLNDIEGRLAANDSSDTDTIKFRREILSDDEDYIINKEYNTFHSPEILKNKSNLGINNGDRIRFVGLVRNTNSRSSREIYGPDGFLITEQNPAATNMLSTSATETHPGATILAQLSFTPITSEDTQRNRINTYKVIAGYNHKDTDNNHLYSSIKYAYTRYFSGYDYIDLSEETISSPAPYIAPIEGVRSNDFNGTVVDINPNMSFITKFNDDPNNDYNTVTFRAYNGSHILLKVSDIVSKYDTVTNNYDYLPIAEIVRNNINQYGGNTYTARQQNRYIPYSDLVPITDTVAIGYKGDTYIQKFNYLKTFKSEDGKRTIAELVSVPLETSVNLDLRFDNTKNKPDNKDADELTSYGFNDVYNQKDTTIKAIPKPSNFQELNNFPLDVLPSKKKFSGELIDSFTDFLINDRITLEGRYGPITALEEFNDNLFTFQRNAISYLAINPRVQINASDGVPIELGSGRLIERYQYMSTNSGSVNKWSITKTKNGLIYFDLLNKSLNFFNSQVQEISTLNGMYNYIKNFSTSNESSLVLDNPLDNTGVLSHYNHIEEDTYITFLTPLNNFTLVYNGLSQGFIGFYDYAPNIYYDLNNKVLTSNSDLNTIWEHGKGEYQTYYGSYFPAYIQLVCNDNPDITKVFDNIHYNSVFKIGTQEQPFLTFNQIEVRNGYQTTGTVPLVLNNSYGAKRHRRFNFVIPREEDTRNRISNPWTFIKLIFDKRLTDNPTSDYNFTLYDLLVSYTVEQ